MGFLRFLKKKDSQAPALEDLDVPPAPPALGAVPNSQDNVFTDDHDPLEADLFGDGLSQGPGAVPPVPPAPQELAPSDMEIPQPPALHDDLSVPPVPPAPSVEEDHGLPTLEPQAQPSPVPPPVPPMPQQPVAPAPAPEPAPQPSIAASSQAQSMQSGKALYLEVNQCKETILRIAGVRSELRKAEQRLSEVSQSVETRDEEFTRFRKSLADIQKKLILVDKMIFKGDTHE